MRCKELMGLLGGAATAWPFAVLGQQPERMRRIGSLSPLAENDPENQIWIRGFRGRYEA
jgi:putative ABC transport system substrate-binding protein